MCFVAGWRVGAVFYSSYSGVAGSCTLELSSLSFSPLLRCAVTTVGLCAMSVGCISVTPFGRVRSATNNLVYSRYEVKCNMLRSLGRHSLTSVSAYVICPFFFVAGESSAFLNNTGMVVCSLCVLLTL